MLKAEKKDNIGISLYALRHTYATSLLRPKPAGAGFTSRDVQVRMGHADLRTTEQYLHAIEAEEHRTDDLPY